MKYQLTYTLYFMGLLLFACSTSKSAQMAHAVQDDPAKVLQAVFEAAKTGEVEHLKYFIPPNGNHDHDVLALCNPGNESMSAELDLNYGSLEDFRRCFKDGRIISVSHEEGSERASIKFWFNCLERSGQRYERMNLIQIDGKWYLSGF